MIRNQPCKNILFSYFRENLINLIGDNLFGDNLFKDQLVNNIRGEKNKMKKKRKEANNLLSLRYPVPSGYNLGKCLIVPWCTGYLPYQETVRLWQIYLLYSYVVWCYSPYACGCLDAILFGDALVWYKLESSLAFHQGLHHKDSIISRISMHANFHQMNYLTTAATHMLL